MKSHTRINDSQELNHHIVKLCEIEPRFSHAYEQTGSIQIRRRDGGYASIVRLIIGQQVSVASAEAMWNRLVEAELFEREQVMAKSVDELKAHGLSRQKATYLLSLAEANIDFDELDQKSNDEIMRILTAVKGIGAWTAETYLMFSLQRSDVTAPADLALQEGAKVLFDLKERPTAKAYAELAKNWSPYRNAASQLLWAYYHVVKGRAGF